MSLSDLGDYLRKRDRSFKTTDHKITWIVYDLKNTTFLIICGSLVIFHNSIYEPSTLYERIAGCASIKQMSFTDSCLLGLTQVVTSVETIAETELRGPLKATVLNHISNTRFPLIVTPGTSL